MATVYLFRNCIALNTECGTVYLPPMEAAKLARAMLRMSQSIVTNGDHIPPLRVADMDAGGNFGNLLEISDYQSKRLISCREVEPNIWRARYRNNAGKLVSVTNGQGIPIAYASPLAALQMALGCRKYSEESK